MPSRRLAAVGTLLLLLAGCGDGGGSSEAVRQSAGQIEAVEETTTTAAPTSTTAVISTSTTRAQGRSSTTAPPTTRRPPTTVPPTTAPAGPRALTPAAPGTYRFDTAGASVFGGSTLPFPAVTTLIVDPPSGVRQHLTRNLRDPTGNGLSTEFTLEYRPEGVFLVSLRLTTTFSGVTDTRELQPSSPVLLLATGARPGTHVEADLTGTSTAKLVLDVLREETITIGGQPTETLVVRAVVTLAPGDVTGRQELTVNVDRGSRLWVRERSVTDAAAAGGLFTLHSEYTAIMQRLTP